MNKSILRYCNKYPKPIKEYTAPRESGTDVILLGFITALYGHLMLELISAYAK